MAGRPRRKRKVRTAAQRAALKKAQAASARKRRNRKIKRGAAQGARVAGAFAGAALSYHIGNYARHPMKARKDYKSAKAAIKKYRTRKAPVFLGTPALPKRSDWVKRGYL